jgi:putative flavoprotein involved in K+ transport
MAGDGGRGRMGDESRDYDVGVIGGGQAGLAVGYYLRRTALRWTILDAQVVPGGAWTRAWRSLRLFSPARYSSLPGWVMQGGDGYPTRDEAIDYLARYEERFALAVRRPVRVSAVRREDGGFRVESDAGDWRARAVVSATGTWAAPYVPDYPGHEAFRGVQLHSSRYGSPGEFAGKRVLVVGGGNSGAQVLAELSKVADATWVTLAPPTFLPDHVDGRYLFEQATALYRAKQEGREPPAADLRGVVMVPPVIEARARGVLAGAPPFARFTSTGVVWPDGREERIDAVIWCTGFRPALDHLRPLGVAGPEGRIPVEGTRSVAEPMLWLVGYGDWTGFASATLIGVGRSARATVREIAAALGGSRHPKSRGAA